MALLSLLGRWVADGSLSPGDERRIRAQIGRDNARRIYPALAEPAR